MVVSVRVISDGETRIRMKRAVEIGSRTHLEPDLAVGVHPPGITLTVERVALSRLWTRL